jgi:glycine cleavage system H protein
MMEFPKDLKYTTSDEWIRVDGKTGTVGLSDYAQSQLSDIVFVEVTAAVGETLDKGKAFASVESVKAASEIYMPVKGKIVAVNDALPGTPELVNSDPYGKAWMIRIEIANPAEVAGLMDAAAYAKNCDERSH